MPLALRAPREAGRLQLAIRAAFGGLERGVDQLLPGGGGCVGVEPCRGQNVFVVEERQRADGCRNAPVLALKLGALHYREEVLFQAGGRKRVDGELLQVAGLRVLAEPAVVQVDHVWTLTGGSRGS